MLVDADPGVCNKTCQQNLCIVMDLALRPRSPGPMSLLGPRPRTLCVCVTPVLTCIQSVLCVSGSLNRAGRFIAVISRRLCCPFALLGKRLFLRSTSSGSLSTALVFVRDIPPPEYANGCIMLLFITFSLMAVGLLGMHVASEDGRSHFAARLYRTLTMMSFLFSLSSGFMFLGYAQPTSTPVSSMQEMLTVRSWGYSQACIKEKNAQPSIQGAFWETRARSRTKRLLLRAMPLVLRVV